MKINITPEANKLILDSVVGPKRFSTDDNGKLCFRYDEIIVDTGTGEVKFVQQGTVIGVMQMRLWKGDILHLSSLDGRMPIFLGER